MYTTKENGGKQDGILIRKKRQLEKEIKRLEKDCFNPKVRPVLKELRARHDELSNAIRILEHE